MSNYADTPLDQIDYGDLSDEDLNDLVENDSRVGAQNAAQSELDRRNTDEDTEMDVNENEDGDLPTPPVKYVEVTQPNGEKVRDLAAKEDAGFVRDSTGAPYKSYGLEAGAGQVQHQMDLANASGVFPADGSPPAGDHTVSAVTGNTVLQDLADKGGTAPEDAAGFENTPDK